MQRCARAAETLVRRQPPRHAAGAAQVRFSSDAANAKDDKPNEPEGPPAKPRATGILRGFFVKLNDEYSSEQSKLFTAANELTPASSALPFPEVHAGTLAGPTSQALLYELQGSVTLVGLIFKQSGQAMLNTWLAPLQQAQQKARVAQIVVTESYVFNMMKGVITRDMQRNVPAELHASTYVLFGDASSLDDVLGVRNRMSGYVFLVDAKGRVRWRGCGMATEPEIAAMLKCYSELLTKPS
jgi:ATP10 protein